MEMSLIFKTKDMRVKLISIQKVVHEDSSLNRGKQHLGNGLLELGILICTALTNTRNYVQVTKVRKIECTNFSARSKLEGAAQL